jgi:carbon storage regulator
MLVLGRRLNESVNIQNAITVTVLRIEGNQVRLGFQAPPEIAIHRMEVFEKIQQEEALNQKST